MEYIEGIVRPLRKEREEVVPEQSYLVLGDNKDNSMDSRYWEDPYILKKDVVAKLMIDK